MISHRYKRRSSIRLEPTRLDHVTNLMNKGEAFLLDGGYTAKHKAELKSSWRKNILEILTILIAIGTFVIGYVQARLTDRTNKLEDKNEQLQKQVDSLIDERAGKPVE